MRTLLVRLVAIASLSTVAAGCNGTDLVAGDVTDVFNPDDNAPAPGPWNPHDVDNDGEPDDVTPPTTYPTDYDSDGDGIPNGDDYIPCMAFYIKVWNHNVSSAEVSLNDQVIVDQSVFPTDEIIQEFINPVPGVNVLELGGKVTGSPQDELHIEIWDAQGTLYMHETIIRGGGKPDAWSGQFEINVQC